MSDAGAEQERLLQALSHILPSISPSCPDVSGLRRLSGGASQEIWAFDACGPGATSPLILRRAPLGARPGAYAAGPELEAAVMRRARSAGVPVPAVHHVLGPQDGIGCGFIMDRIDGETSAPRILREDRYAPARAHFADQASGILAHIHRLSWDGLGVMRQATPTSELDDLESRLRQGPTPRPVFQAALRWLRQNAPAAPDALQVVHGDFRNGNLIFGPEGVRAVLDWELVHLGDPMEDLGWLSVGSWRFGRLDRPFGGVTESDAFLERYAAHSGRPVDRAALRFWEMLGTLRWGVMCADMVAWVRSGEDRSVERVAIARRASETEIDILRLLTWTD